MTTKEVVEALAKVSYKPDCRLAVFTGDLGEVILRITRVVRDADNPTVSVNQQKECIFDRISGVDELRHRILRFFEELEIHEAREWLRIDGRRLIEPHPSR